MLQRLTITTICVALATLSLTRVKAETDVDRAIPATPEGTVRIHNPRGAIAVVGWDRDEVRVEGTLDDLAEDLIIQEEDTLTSIRVRLPKRNVNWGDGSTLTIRIPHASTLHADGLSSDFDVTAIRGTVAIRTVSGDVDVRGATGRTRVKTVSGDVDVMASSGPLVITTTSGDIDLDSSAERVLVDTIAGDVEITLERFVGLTARSESGALSIEGELAPAGRIMASSVSADIELELDEPNDVRIRAVAGGRIDNDLNDERPRRGAAGQHVLTTVLGDGSSTVNVRTLAGDIEIE